MSTSDYSQWGEQGIILDYFGDHVGRFLDIGAYDGMRSSNTRCLSDRYWSGVCIEPAASSFPRLVENHRLNEKITCVQAALAPQMGLVKFADTGSPVSSCLPHENIKTYIQREYYVCGVTPDEISRCFGDQWDFVSLDVEGMEMSVIDLMEPLLKNTRLVCFEDAPPCTDFSNSYYDAMLYSLRKFGLTEVVGRTTVEGRLGNTLVGRG
jgi:FkbM family methyltransferase